MRKANRWTHSRLHFVLPPLPEEQKGQCGCGFCRATFDGAIGEEVYLHFMEEPDFTAAYERVSPFTLVAHTGLVPTPHGSVAFIVWQFAAGSEQETMVEQFLNPRRTEMLRLISCAASQTHLKLLIVNNQSGEVGSFIDFENTFGLDALALTMSIVNDCEPKGDFKTAVQHVTVTMSTSELIALSTLT